MYRQHRVTGGRVVFSLFVRIKNKTFDGYLANLASMDFRDYLNFITGISYSQHTFFSIIFHSKYVHQMTSSVMPLISLQAQTVP